MHRSARPPTVGARGSRTRSAQRLGAAILALFAALSLASPPASGAEGVRSAEARMKELQRLQEQTTARLVEGTQKWESELRALKATRLALRNTQRRVRQAEADLDAMREQVGVVAATLYRNPAPAGLQLAFTRSPDEIIGAVQALSALDRAAGSQAGAIARAMTARQQLSRQQVEANRLQREAAALVAGAAARLEKLKALAESTAQKLADAQAALGRAREAARQRALEAAARASRARASDLPSCSGKSTQGQSNGNLDPASLCPLWGAPGHRARYDAAAAFNRMSKAHAASRGRPLCVTDSYRSYSEQVDLYRRKPGLAAVPGTSEHGWGKAVDFCGGVERTGTAAHEWMRANAGRFGWFNPDWAQPGGSRPEPWHWEYSG